MDRFVMDEESVAVTEETSTPDEFTASNVQEALLKLRPPSPNKKQVTFQMPSQESIDYLARINALECTVADLKLRVISIHELLSRFVKANLESKGAPVPTYEPETVQQAVQASGITVTTQQQTVSLLRNNSGKIIIKGKTFDIKDELKRRFSAQWDGSLKSWVVDATHGDALTAYLNEKGFTVS